MEAYEAIITRKSVRSFVQKPVSDELVDKILLAATRAPSGMGKEPWRFAVLRSGETKTAVAGLTRYTAIIDQADVTVCLFLDHEAGYDTTKDANTIGACAQNILLAAHALGLGAVWIGEILRNKNQVAACCGVDGSRYELMAVIPIGYSAEPAEPRPRKHTVADCIIAKK